MARPKWLEALIAIVCLLIFVRSQYSNGSEVWRVSGAVCRIGASLMMVALLAQWEWTARADRRGLEIAAKSGLCAVLGITALLAARLEKTVDSKVLSSLLDLVVPFGLLGFILFAMSLALVGSRTPSR